MSEHNDKAIERALSRKRDILEELSQIDTFVTLYRKYAGVADATAQDTNQAPAISSTEVSGVAAVTHVTSKNPAPKGMRQPEFVAFVREMLIEHGRPLQAHEILAGFHDSGRHVGGSDETSNLKTKLWRAKKEITPIPGSGYWPIDLPCTAVSYNPAHRGLSIKTIIEDAA